MPKDLEATFSRAAPRYDFFNRILSLGLDKPWRKSFIGTVPLEQGANVLDLCTGTGDLAIGFARRKEVLKVTGVDFSDEMLIRARSKVDKLKLSHKIDFIKSDVFKLDLKRESFDAVSIGFGLRNLSDRKAGLGLMASFLKKGGWAAILEFCRMDNFYIKNIIPLIGPEYAYLSSSIRAFHAPKEIIKLMQASGFTNIKHKSLDFGIAHIFVGQK